MPLVGLVVLQPTAELPRIAPETCGTPEFQTHDHKAYKAEPLSQCFLNQGLNLRAARIFQVKIRLNVMVVVVVVVGVRGESVCV